MPKLRPTLSTINTLRYNIPKFLLPIQESLFDIESLFHIFSFSSFSFFWLELCTSECCRCFKNFRKGRHAPTFRNGKFSTSLGAYSISFPPEAISVPYGNFSFHGSHARPKKHFYIRKSLNLLSLLWIQYIQWKADIQCQLKLNFFDAIQSIIQD